MFSVSVNTFSVEFPLACYQQAGRVWYVSGALRRTYTLFYPAPQNNHNLTFQTRQRSSVHGLRLDQEDLGHRDAVVRGVVTPSSHPRRWVKVRAGLDLIKLFSVFVTDFTYCEQTPKWNNNGVSRNSLFKTMMGCKGLLCVFISNRKKGKESKIAERQRESVCVRGRALWKEEIVSQ